MQLTLIAGARPNFMKIAPLARALESAGSIPRIVHTGQHYDERMSRTFFEELQIPTPQVNLGVGSGTHVEQIAEVMRRLEQELIQNRPDAVVVVGDVNSTLAAALTAVKLQIPVAHVEAGLRSFDRTMPEETNRVLTDAISQWLFTSEPAAKENLRREGIPAERIHFVGNVMIDTLLLHREPARQLKMWEQFEVEPGQYVVLTLHRPSNVDCPQRLDAILQAIESLAERIPVVFTVHPRTEKRLEEFALQKRVALPGIRCTEPLGYRAMLGLMDAARLVLTDSGGIQEETTALGVPCLTLRENTERPVTVDRGTNRLVGWKSDAILTAAWKCFEERTNGTKLPQLWDGKAAERVAKVLMRETQCPHGQGNVGQGNVGRTMLVSHPT